MSKTVKALKGPQRTATHHESFTESISALGEKWFKAGDHGPSPIDPTHLLNWHNLIKAMVEDRDFPLIIRRSGRGTQLEHKSRRKIFIQDNGPAHDIFSLAYMTSESKLVPSISSMNDACDKGRFRSVYIDSEANVAKADDISLEEECGRCVASVKAFGLNQCAEDKRGWRICHIVDTGIGTLSKRQMDLEASELPPHALGTASIDRLKAHMGLFLSPRNMILVPIDFGGVGECKSFLAPFDSALPDDVVEWAETLYGDDYGRHFGVRKQSHNTNPSLSDNDSN